MEQVLRKEVALNWEREAGGQGRTGHRGAGGEEWAALGWGGEHQPLQCPQKPYLHFTSVLTYDW